MEDLKKPYECRHRGCSMSFVTKDRLDVHVRTHNLSLTLTPTTPFKTIFVDETPTPTRFLKELETEVFQELNSVNPFDATFRKANSGNGPNHSFIIPESSTLIASLPDSEVLNTPSITLHGEPATPILLKTNFSKKKPDTEDALRNGYSDNTTDTLPFTPDDRPGTEDSVMENADLSLEDSSTFMSSESAFLDDEAQMGEMKTPTPSVQTPVIMSIGHSSLLKPNTTGVPTAVVVTRPTVNPAQNFVQTPMSVDAEKTSQAKGEPPQAVVQSVCVTPMVQVIIRLPDGQTMPVQFPVMSQVPAPTVTATPVPVPSSTPVSIPNATPVVHAAQSSILESQIPTSTKMKLKERLTTHSKSSSALRNGSAQMKHRSKPPVIQPLPHEDVLAEFGLSPPSSPIVHRPGHNGRKRREPSDNPDDKRRRSLERNRAAATRCREKKKVWITALEQKAEELENVNTNLQHEVSQLRNEVAQLKTMLLAHKDCPVTLQQKGMAYAERNAYTTVQIITHSPPEDLQRVPNSSVISPLKAEFMEVEMSSVQSSSDASLTSDTSEASFKER